MMHFMRAIIVFIYRKVCKSTWRYEWYYQYINSWKFLISQKHINDSNTMSKLRKCIEKKSAYQLVYYFVHDSSSFVFYMGNCHQRDFFSFINQLILDKDAFQCMYVLVSWAWFVVVFYCFSSWFLLFHFTLKKIWTGSWLLQLQNSISTFLPYKILFLYVIYTL